MTSCDQLLISSNFEIHWAPPDIHLSRKAQVKTFLYGYIILSCWKLDDNKSCPLLSFSAEECFYLFVYHHPSGLCIFSSLLLQSLFCLSCLFCCRSLSSPLSVCFFLHCFDHFFTSLGQHCGWLFSTLVSFPCATSADRRICALKTLLQHTFWR